MRETAEKYYHGDEGYNCAQAVFKTFQNEYDISEDTILAHKKSGGGRVEGNICGALHAAALLAEDKKDEFYAKFIEKAGSVKCNEIRKAKELSCRGCAGYAAEILHESRSA